jgi:zinc transport system substrate-binding protein
VRAIIILTSAALVITGAVGCGNSGHSSGKTEIVASFYPLAYAAQEIGGRRVDVRNLTPTGGEPHDLEISPRSIAAIKSADLVLLLGHRFQPQIEEAAGSGDHTLRLLDTPGLNRFGNGDPHVWLDPVRYALIVKRIGAALDDKRAERRLVRRLEALNRDYERGLAHCERHEIVTSHEAFAYLAQRYGLRQVAITGLTPEAEPSPKDLEHVIQLVRRTHATTIYFETLVSPRIAKTVARETAARTAVLDPIEGLTDAEQSRGENYFALMRANLQELRKGLACR